MEAKKKNKKFLSKEKNHDKHKNNSVTKKFNNPNKKEEFRSKSEKHQKFNKDKKFVKEKKENHNKEKKLNKEDNKDNLNENKNDKENKNINIIKENKKEIKKENDDNMKEIFIRNIGYTTSEEKLKNLFVQLVPEDSIEFCLLCKDKETQNNKGSAFIKLSKESYNKIMSLYKDYSSRKHDSFIEMNPFELDGRYLKLFDAVSRDELKNIEKEKEKKDSKRNKNYLYYGLSKESIIKFKEYENITDSDKEKRERLIQIKKDNYYKNPNFHVSETRLSFRNIDKNITEKNLKDKIYDLLNNDDIILKEYKNIKLIKQIKLLKEDDDKSKCVAFVECVNFKIAKFIIDNLSGIVLNPNSKKGLIIDFCLDDFRKKLSREKKLERLKEIKKQRKIEEKEKKKIENTKKNKDENKKEKKSEIKDCNDINKLIDLYHTTLSRGKKQRIKKKLKNLGYNKDIPPAILKKEKTIDLNEKNEKDNDDMFK